MRKAVFLVLLFFISVMAPLASSATTETQFKGGATSYTKTFSGQGNGSAGAITFPFGAELHLLSLISLERPVQLHGRT